MPNHDYICPPCSARHEVWSSLADGPPEIAECPRCSSDTYKAYDAAGTCGISPVRPGFSDGHTIFQLPANCPDRHVTSQKAMDKTYQKYGIDPDTHAPIPGKESMSGAHNFGGSGAARERRKKRLNPAPQGL